MNRAIGAPTRIPTAPDVAPRASVKVHPIRTAFQLLLLSAVCTLVVTVLWIRDTRSAANTITDDRVWQIRCGELPGIVVRQEDVSAAGYEDGRPWIPSARISWPRQMEEILPVGTSYYVTIRGGLVAKMKDREFGTRRQASLCLAYEVAYRRTIESNDGCRVVELRQFDAVRMAKIVSPATGMQLEFDSPRSPHLAQLSYAGPGDGIRVADPAKVAEAILAEGAEAVAADPASRAFTEEDLLSGKSVQLTYVKGVGLESIEPIGWTLTKPLAQFLFCQPCSLRQLLPTSGAQGEQAEIMVLSGLLPPPISPYSSQPVRFAKLTGDDAAGDYEILLLPEPVRARHKGGRRPRSHTSRRPRGEAWPGEQQPQELPQPVRMGTCQIDPSGQFIAEATLHWSLADTTASPYHLFFESPLDFQGRPQMTIRYSCIAD